MSPRPPRGPNGSDARRARNTAAVLQTQRSRLVVAVAAALALADASIVTLALPRLLTEFDATVEGVAAVIGVYTIVLALGLLPAEALRRRTGGGPLGAFGLVVFAAACLGCAAAPSLEALLALRALQAVGGAAALVAAFELLDAGAPSSPGRGLWNAAAIGGLAAGPALGGILTQALDWRAIFAAQIPLAVAGAAVFVRGRTRVAGPPPAARRGQRPAARRAMLALALASAALTAVLFLLVLLLVAGWNLSPIGAAVTVSVLPLAALAASRAHGDARARAATGCLLIAAGTFALAFLPDASPLWAVVPQLLAGAGMGLALPALAGELIPERSPADAGRLLTARHAGIALALLVLAPIVSSNLTSATERARERGVAIVLDSPLPPVEKIRLAPTVLTGVNADEPRAELKRALAAERSGFEGEERADYDRLAARADDTLVAAVADSFRTAFVIAAALALVAALLVLPARARLKPLALIGALALVVPLAYVVLESSTAPEPVVIANPCEDRDLPDAPGLGGVLQDEALERLDAIACQFGSSREELVLAAADEEDAARYERRYGANPRSGGDLLQGAFGD
jgi:predicted MFS family arabinose efflux permease